MSVTSLRSRLTKAIDRLPLEDKPKTKAEIDARLIAVGCDPDALMAWVVANPNATDLEAVIAFSPEISTAELPGRKWTEAQALKFLKWRKEKRQTQYYRTVDGGVVRQ